MTPPTELLAVLNPLPIDDATVRDSMRSVAVSAPPPERLVVPLRLNDSPDFFDCEFWLSRWSEENGEAYYWFSLVTGLEDEDGSGDS